MIDAPETIWAWPHATPTHCSKNDPSSNRDAIQYRRADLPLTTAQLMSDPNAVHINMLHGRIANPSVEQIVHIYAGKVQAVSVEPVTVQQAARVLLDQHYSIMSVAFYAMEKLQGEGENRILAAALRAIAGEKP